MINGVTILVFVDILLSIILTIFGLIHCGGERDRVGRFIDEYPVVGTLDTLERFVDLYGIERLIVAASLEAEPILLKRLRSAKVFTDRDRYAADFAFYQYSLPAAVDVLTRSTRHKVTNPPVESLH